MHGGVREGDQGGESRGVVPGGEARLGPTHSTEGLHRVSDLVIGCLHSRSSEHRCGKHRRLVLSLEGDDKARVLRGSWSLHHDKTVRRVSMLCVRYQVEMAAISRPKYVEFLSVGMGFSSNTSTKRPELVGRRT